MLPVAVAVAARAPGRICLRCYVPARRILPRTVIAHAGAIYGAVVAAKYFTLSSLHGGHPELRKAVDCGQAAGVFADGAARVCAHRVEIAQQGGAGIADLFATSRRICLVMNLVWLYGLVMPPTRDCSGER